MKELILIISRVALIGFQLVALYILAFNCYWTYNFRGSISKLIIADKQMKYINQHFQNALCLYNDFTQPYYSLHTSNYYVNVDPRYASSYTAVYSIEPQGLHLLNLEKYSHLIVFDEQLLRGAPPFPPVVIDSRVPGSVYDSFQSMMNIPIRSTNLYNTSFNGISPYPAHAAFFILK
jgi:hypothetical protein